MVMQYRDIFLSPNTAKVCLTSDHVPMAQQEVNNSLGCGTPAEERGVDATSPAQASWLSPRGPRGRRENTPETRG